MVADEGFWGRGYQARLADSGTRLLTPDKTRTAANLARERALASTRLAIERVLANLEQQMRLDHHLARTIRSVETFESAGSSWLSANAPAPRHTPQSR